MGQIAATLDLAGPALAGIGLEGMETVELTRARPGGRRIRQPAIGVPAAMVEDVTTPVAPAIHEQLDRTWQAAGWGDGSPSFGGGAWAGYADERNYEPLVPAERRKW